MKRLSALFLHLLFLCLGIAGVTFIIFNENYGRGIGWLHEESYADTAPFAAQLEADVENIFQYVQYKDFLEQDGEVNYDAAMFCVTYTSGITKIYTLSEAISYARRLGYYLNEDYEVAGGPDVHERDNMSVTVPMIEWKTYAPDEVYLSPGDEYATIEELATQVMTVLGDYYRIRDVYIDRPSNLYFRVSYLNDMGKELLYTNAPDMDSEDLKNLGRYVFMSGDSIFIDTNLQYVPENIISLLSSYNQYGNENYYILLGIDISFPNQDPYAIEHTAYTRTRTEYIGGIVLFFAGALGLCITLIAMIVLAGHREGTHNEIHLYYFDKLPFECLVAVYLLLLWGAGFAARTIIVRLARLVINPDHIPYCIRMARYTLIYLVTLFVGMSFLRNYKAMTIWKGSLLYRGLSRILPALSNYPMPLKFTAGFIGYVFCNTMLITGSHTLYRQKEVLTLPYLYLVPLIILIGFQIWVFLLLYRDRVEISRISTGIFKMAEGDTTYKIDSAGFSENARHISNALNSMGDGLNTALQEQVKSERLKADLITNVSHDIKTPLTSIINYVDLLKREKIQDEKIQGYLEVLDQKSQRLKTLTEDLVEASKASSGNLKLEITDIDLVELIQQSNGEFEEKFATRHLDLVSDLPSESVVIAADGRRLWRVVENLYNNAFKYAMENSRIYVDVKTLDGWVYFTIKNISANPLNINADELTERFVRGDVARTTEGSGLGLSIAKSLTELQGGVFEIYIDGDLFKAQVGFPVL